MSRWMIVLVACALTASALTAPAGAQDEPLTLEEGLARIRDLGDEQRWDEALPVAEALVAAYPDRADAVLWRGLTHEALGNRKAARADFDRVMRLDPANLRARYRLLYVSQPPLDAAAFEAALREFIDRCTDAIEADPLDSEAALHRGLALHALGDRPAAEAELRVALELHSNDSDALRGLLGLLPARLWYLHNDERRALLERIVDLRPRDVLAREELGACYDIDKRYAEAVEQYRQALRLNPRRANPYGLLAALQWRRYGQSAAALEVAERGIAAEPTHSTCWNVRARILLEEYADPAAAIAVLDQARAAGAESDALHVTRGRALEAMGRSDEAIAMLAEAIARSSDAYALRFNRAQLLHRAGRYEEALREVDAIEELEDPLGQTAHLRLREFIERSMPDPEPQPEDDGAPAAPPEEGN